MAVSLKRGPSSAQAETWSRGTRPLGTFAPDDIRAKNDSQAFGRLGLRVGAAAAALALLAVGFSGFRYYQSSSDETTATETNQRLVTEYKRYQPLESYVNDLKGVQDSMKPVLDSDINYGAIQDAINAATPAGVKIIDTKATYGHRCTSNQPASAAPAIGCYIIKASTTNEALLPQMIQNLREAKTKGGAAAFLADPYWTLLTKDADQRAFSISVNYDQAAYSNKFLRVFGDKNATNEAPKNAPGEGSAALTPGATPTVAPTASASIAAAYEGAETK